MQLNSEIRLKAYMRIFEYSTTTLEDQANIVHSVYLHVESSLKYLISIAHLPYLCLWLAMWRAWLLVHFITTSSRVKPCIAIAM